MNKKFLCGALALVMTLSALPLSACKEKPKTESGNNGGTTQGGNNNGNNGGNGGNSGGNGGNSGGNGGNSGGNGGNSGGNGGGNGGDAVIEPGTVITDEAVKKEIYDSLSNAQPGGFTYSAGATVNVTVGESVETKTYKAEGAVVFSGETISADLYASVDSKSGENSENQYFVAFVRDGYAYTAQGELQEGETFAAIKEQLKDAEDPLVLSRTELAFDRYLQEPALVKLVKNLPSLGDGTVTKTEGGYTLGYDLMNTADSLLSSAGGLATAVDTNHGITLGALFHHNFLKTNLEKLLNGITAEELYNTLKDLLPEEISASLPEPVKSATAASYAEKLLLSGSFFTQLAGEEEALEGYKTFAEVPLEKLMTWITGEEFSFGDRKLAEALEEFRQNLDKQAVTAMFGLIGIEGGELSGENLDLKFEFAFGDDKKLLGFSAEGLGEGEMTAPAPNPDEGDAEGGSGSGEDSEGNGGSDNGSEDNGGSDNGSEDNGGSDNGSEDNGGSDNGSEGNGGADNGSEDNGGAGSGNGSNESDSGENIFRPRSQIQAKEQGEGDLRSARGTVKIEAACAQSPELFDLVGCKYENEEGETATIRK